MHDRSREMLEVFQQLRGFDRPEHAPSFVNTRYGCSVSFDASRRAIAFSLFAFARHMGESDARIREHIAKISADRGWDMSGYLALTQRSADAPAPGRCEHHNVLGCAVSRQGEPCIYVSLTPPRRRA
ncbi:unnamed protein product [Laminaria digitata]